MSLGARLAGKSFARRLAKQYARIGSRVSPPALTRHARTPCDSAELVWPASPRPDNNLSLRANVPLTSTSHNNDRIHSTVRHGVRAPTQYPRPCMHARTHVHTYTGVQSSKHRRDNSSRWKLTMSAVAERARAFKMPILSRKSSRRGGRLRDDAILRTSISYDLSK